MSSLSHSSQKPLKWWTIFNWLSFRAVVYNGQNKISFQPWAISTVLCIPPFLEYNFLLCGKTSLRILPSPTKTANTLSHCIVRYVYILPSNQVDKLKKGFKRSYGNNRGQGGLSEVSPVQDLVFLGAVIGWELSLVEGALVRLTLIVCVCVSVCVCLHAHSVVPDSLRPWIVACQAPLSMDFSRQESWSGLFFPSPGDLPNPGIRSMSPLSHALAGRFFTSAPPGKPSHSPWPKAPLSWGLSWYL